MRMLRAMMAEPDVWFRKGMAMLLPAWRSSKFGALKTWRLLAAGSPGRLRSTLEEAWARQPRPDLAAAHLAEVREPLVRVKAGETLASGKAKHPESHLLIGRFAIEAGLTGRAQSEMDALLATGQAHRRGFLALADLEKVEKGDSAGGRQAQSRWLRQAAVAAQEARLRCAKCGIDQVAWEVVCSNCRRSVPSPGSARGNRRFQPDGDCGPALSGAGRAGASIQSGAGLLDERPPYRILRLQIDAKGGRRFVPDRGEAQRLQAGTEIVRLHDRGDRRVQLRQDRRRRASGRADRIPGLHVDARLRQHFPHAGHIG